MGLNHLPKHVPLANLPTRIEKLERFTKAMGGPEIWIKRDDQTGTELSGNKVRKLEFAIQEALDQSCDYLITCGGIQSNHARATAVSAAKLGMGAVLLLVGEDGIKPEGNHLLDLLVGAEVRFVSGKDYAENRQSIMDGIRTELQEKGHKAYIIPEGASNGIGAFGYVKAMTEIHQQEKELGFQFDCIVSATGSGGTYGGMLLGDALGGHARRMLGFAVGKDRGYFQREVAKILTEAASYLQEVPRHYSEIEINDDYIGKGYALSSPELIEFIRDFPRLEGIVLDPVYTGKAMFGLAEEIRKGNLKDCKRLLFVHTGGLFGLLGKAGDFGQIAGR